ncbi:MAG: ABC transporter ATP-binding protein [Eubacteriales bacterium]|nr:ABC transporter ATP-binding protein [Eubacteriales bacterium]
MKTALKYLRPFRISIIFVVIFVFIQSTVELLLPNFMSSIVQQGIIANDTAFILKTGGIMLAVSLIGVAATILVSYLSSKVSMGMGRDMRGDIFNKAMAFSLNEFDTIGTSSMITRSTNDVQHLQMVTIMILRMVISSPILAVGGVFMAVSKNPGLSLIFLAALPVIGVLIFIVAKKGRPLFSAMQKKLDKLNLVMRERLIGIRVIRAYDKEEDESLKFNEANRDLTDTAIKVNRIMATLMPVIMMVMNGTALSIIWFSSHKIAEGTMNVGDMMAFIQYAMLILMSLLMLSMIFVMLPRAAVSAERIKEVLQTEPSITDKVMVSEAVPVTCRDDLLGCIEFRNVSFSYPGASEPVLHDISFKATPGEMTAIIGSTGSGKSTVVNLIPRFYDIDSGEILIDGVNIAEMKQSELREKIGYVPQKAVLFSGTIADNLRFGNDDASDEQLERAAKIAMAYDFITEKSEGFNEPVSQGGTNVSGGQKQRLSIARAIAKDPEIYIFDDSFSALDARTDRMLRDALRKEISRSTVIIVSQRVSTVMDADRIIVLNDGRMVGMGTHDELIRSNAIYREIVESQLPAHEGQNEGGSNE